MLYVVPTPVGNLEDITLRGLRLLQSAEVIITEDSRQTRKLMTLLQIDSKPQFIDITKNHQLNLSAITKTLDQERINQIQEKETVVLLVSDSGTPGISDPGREVIQIAREKGVLLTVLPGATAFVPALVASGIVAKDFWFLGFLPIKKGRKTLWEQIIRSQSPIVLYESVHRMEKFRTECLANLEPARRICICKEISKKFETLWVGKVEDLVILDFLDKGEFVVVIDKQAE